MARAGPDGAAPTWLGLPSLAAAVADQVPARIMSHCDGEHRKRGPHSSYRTVFPLLWHLMSRFLNRLHVKGLE